jgi:hypothetical protein
LSPLVGDTYYLLGKTAIYSFSVEDAFPQHVVDADIVRENVRLFVSDSGEYLIALSSDITEMGGGLNKYLAQVLNLKTKEYYAREIDGDNVAQEDVLQVSEKTEVLRDGDEMYIELSAGKKLSLDLKEKTFVLE